MSASYYPPSHPAGMRREEDTVTCRWCGARVDVVYTFDLAVNASDVDLEDCPNCGGGLFDSTLPPKGCPTCAREGLYIVTGGGPCEDCKEGS